MVEVLGGRAREPTGPHRAPRTYPGLVQLQVRRVGPRKNIKVTSVTQKDSKSRGICVETSSEKGQVRPKLIARYVQGAKNEKLPSEKIDPTGQDETEKEDVSPSGRPFAARFKYKSEPDPGSCIRSEAGERNVAERWHGHPCGQQPMDEVNGHRPQRTETSRLGVHRRRCRFWSAGFSDHRQQRSDAQPTKVLGL
ncbi:PREDICTED: uncharacterized protein LOC105152949 [Acromyrmex echinatior]|uniref:uncharacterized protein LOC105152949 n=1 Tax=Acromyrmex echinatior TaxID=103372 RepID=UPI000580F081|nr:PREDICTED: uncharacterized protein LOC105152949 [Acromyrmex echinatior]